MSEQTAISWCDSTWSPWEGCTQVSPACDHCYAKRMNDWLRKGENWGPGAPRREYSDGHWDKPLRWNAKAEREGRQIRVFPSVCDPFDNEVDRQRRAEFFTLIAGTPNLTWLLLTKRIGNARAMLPGDWGDGYPNVWLGATICNQEEADRDIPKLLAVPAAVRFLSIEPMLGPVWLGKYLKPGCTRHGQSTEADGKCDVCEGRGIWSIGVPLAEHEKAPLHSGLHWVICGGESGPQARPMHPDWVRSLRDQCAAASRAFHFKQWGEWVPVEVDLPGDGKRYAVLDDGSERDITTLHRSGRGSYAMQRMDGGQEMARIGTKAAGRLLDGAEHNGFPA